jgi:hypothetical protein
MEPGATYFDEAPEITPAMHRTSDEYEENAPEDYAVVTGAAQPYETGSVRVKVSLPNGDPIPNMPFYLEDRFGVTRYASGMSGADGACTLEGAPKGSQVRLSFPRRHTHEGRPVVQSSDHLLFDLLADTVLHELVCEQPRLCGSIALSGPWDPQTLQQHLPPIPEIRVELRKNNKTVAETLTDPNMEFFLQTDSGGQYTLRLPSEIRLGPYLAVCRQWEMTVCLREEGCFTLSEPIIYDVAPGMVVGQVSSDTGQAAQFTLSALDMITGAQTPVTIDAGGCYQLSTAGPVALLFPQCQTVGATKWELAPGQSQQQTFMVASRSVQIAAGVAYRQFTPALNNGAHGMLVGQIDCDVQTLPPCTVNITSLIDSTTTPVATNSHGCFTFCGSGPYAIHFPLQLTAADGTILPIHEGRAQRQKALLAAGETHIADTVAYRQVPTLVVPQPIRWVVTDSFDRPLPGALVKLCDPSRIIVYDWKLTGSDGSCSLQPAQTGPQTIVVFRNSHETGEPIVTDITV